MPLALLLQERLGVITEGVRRTDAFAALFDRATLVLRRQQGAFLVAWFGPGVPIDGVYLRVAVANGAEIQQRVGAARGLQQRYAAALDRGPNLFEPVAGVAGVVGGAILGSFLGAARLGHLALSIVELVSSCNLGGVVGRGRTLWSGYKDFVGRAGDEGGDVIAQAEGGRAAGRLAGPILDIGAQALGRRRREGVPGMFLTLLDRLAGLAAQVLGAVATFARLVPVVRIVSAAGRPALAFLEAMKNIAVAAVMGTVQALEAAVANVSVRRILNTFLDSLERAVAGVEKYVIVGLRKLRRPFKLAGAAFEAEWARQGQPIVDALVAHPFSMLIGAVRRQTAAKPHELLMSKATSGVFGAIAPLLARIGNRLFPSAPGSGPGTFTRLLAALGRGLRALWRWAMSGPPGPWAALGTAISNIRTAVRTPPPSLTRALAPTIADTAVRDIRALTLPALRPTAPTVFPAEARRLEAEQDRVRTDPAFATATRLLHAAAHIAGPEIEAHVARLEQKLVDVERTVRGRRRSPLPVRDLPPPNRLVPVISRLRISGRSRDHAQVSAWARAFVRELSSSAVPVPALVTAH